MYAGRKCKVGTKHKSSINLRILTISKRLSKYHKSNYDKRFHYDYYLLLILKIKDLDIVELSLKSCPVGLELHPSLMLVLSQQFTRS
jgi:hypothetical protein